MLRETRKQVLKDRIYEEAMALFRHKGFDQVTVEEITQACGIAKGTFYNYFPRKESVLLHLSVLQMEAVQERLANTLNSTDPKETLQGLFNILIDRYTGDKELVLLMMMETIRSRPAITEEARSMDQFQSMIARLLEDARANRRLSPTLDCAAAAAVIAGIYFHTLMAWASSADGTPDMRTLFKSRFELAWHGIQGADYSRPQGG